MNRLRGWLLIALSTAACSNRLGTLPANRDHELDLHEAQLLCERWQAFGDHADPGAALERARFALTLTTSPLTDDACMTPTQLSAEALQSAETAARAMPQDPAVFVVLSDCRIRFGRDPAGAAEASCKAADLAPADHRQLEACGDLLVRAGKPADGIERWTAAVRLAAGDEAAFPLLDKLLAWYDRDAELLASLPPALVEGHEQWKRAQRSREARKALENRAEDAAHEEKEEKRRQSERERDLVPTCEELSKDPFTDCPDDFNQRVRDLVDQSIQDGKSNPWLE